jgi:hypothetical protein
MARRCAEPRRRGRRPPAAAPAAAGWSSGWPPSPARAPTATTPPGGVPGARPARSAASGASPGTVGLPPRAGSHGRGNDHPDQQQAAQRLQATRSDCSRGVWVGRRLRCGSCVRCLRVRRVTPRHRGTQAAARWSRRRLARTAPVSRWCRRTSHRWRHRYRSRSSHRPAGWASGSASASATAPAPAPAPARVRGQVVAEGPRVGRRHRRPTRRPIPGAGFACPPLRCCRSRTRPARHASTTSTRRWMGNAGTDRRQAGRRSGTRTVGRSPACTRARRPATRPARSPGSRRRSGS